MTHEELVGRELPPYEMRVEHGKVVEFATAVMARDPVHFGTEAAAAAGYDAVVAPPTFSAVTGHWAPPDPTGNALGLDLRRVLAGGNEWEYHGAVVAGDVLTVRGRVADVGRKNGRRGGMTKILLEYTFANHEGETVLVSRSTIFELDAVEGVSA